MSIELAQGQRELPQEVSDLRVRWAQRVPDELEGGVEFVERFLDTPAGAKRLPLHVVHERDVEMTLAIALLGRFEHVRQEL